MKKKNKIPTWIGFLMLGIFGFLFVNGIFNKWLMGILTATGIIILIINLKPK